MQRRTILKTVACGSLLSAVRANASSPPLVVRPVPRLTRLIVLDWGLIETLLAMGITPLGVAESEAYNKSVVEPMLPSGVVDVGLRLSPSLELMQQLAPDVILINSSQESQRPMLERIAPVRAFAIYTDAGAPWDRSVAVTRELGQLCRCEAQAEALIQRADDVLTANRRHLARSRFAPLPPTAPARGQTPIYLIQFFDPRHIGIYGQRSVFQDVMHAIGMRNAWTGPTDYWGVGIAGIEKLAMQPDAAILYFGSLPAAVSSGLASNRLWHALPAIADGRVAALPAFWGFGMLPSAMRFANALTTALTTL